VFSATANQRHDCLWVAFNRIKIVLCQLAELQSSVAKSQKLKPVARILCVGPTAADPRVHKIQNVRGSLMVLISPKESLSTSIEIRSRTCDMSRYSTREVPAFCSTISYKNSRRPATQTNPEVFGSIDHDWTYWIGPAQALPVLIATVSRYPMVAYQPLIERHGVKKYPTIIYHYLKCSNTNTPWYAQWVKKLYIRSKLWQMLADFHNFNHHVLYMKFATKFST